MALWMGKLLTWDSENPHAINWGQVHYYVI